MKVISVIIVVVTCGNWTSDFVWMGRTCQVPGSDVPSKINHRDPLRTVTNPECCVPRVDEGHVLFFQGGAYCHHAMETQFYITSCIT